MRTGALFRLAKQEAAAPLCIRITWKTSKNAKEYPLDFVSYVSQMFADYHEDRPWFKANTPERFVDERGFYE